MATILAQGAIECIAYRGVPPHGVRQHDLAASDDRIVFTVEERGRCFSPLSQGAAFVGHQQRGILVLLDSHGGAGVGSVTGRRELQRLAVYSVRECALQVVCSIDGIHAVHRRMCLADT